MSLLTRMFDVMSQQPSDQEIVDIKATEEEEERLNYLSNRSHDNQLTSEEDDELKELLSAQYLMIIAKGFALGRLKRAAN